MSDPNPSEVIYWNSPPVVGQRVSGVVVSQTTNGQRGYKSSFQGIYDGIVTTEDGGWLVHRFHDGVLGRTPQAHFGFVAGERDGLTERVSGVVRP